MAAASRQKNKETEEENVVKEAQLVLTPSEKALGIRITQPKQKTIDIMTRLYAVPSEKLRVWTSWLTKVGERADDWHWWLRAQIGLALRISDHLQRATLALEAEKSAKLGQGDGASEATATPEEEGGIETATEINEADLTDAEAASPGQETPLTEEETTTESEKTVVPGETATEIDEADLTEAETASPGQETPLTEEETATESEKTVVPEGEPVDTQQPVEQAEVKKSEAKGDKNKDKKGKKTKGKDKPEAKIVYEEGFWPVGVRWKPLSQRGKQKPPPQRQPDDIPIPKTEEEMAEVIRRVRHQGVIYRSFYKHWTKTADQAVKEVIGRTVLPTKQVYLNGEDVPYLFYLESEPDIDYVIEHDDEEVLLPDPGREKITSEFTHLYFNLSDKPGKGGKPWI